MSLLKSLPNALSVFRLLMVPVLLGLAWTGRPVAFLVAFGTALASDVVDGWIARAAGVSSELGAKLDSWGDLATYVALPISAWWLWPDRILAQLALVVVAGIAFVAPTLIGLLKFGRLTSYHTRAAKLCAIAMGAGLLLYLGFGIAWLFQIAVLLLLVEAIEEIAITAVLPEWRANVPSIFAARRIVRAAVPAALAAALLWPALAVAQLLPDMVPEVSDVHFQFHTNVSPGDVAEGCATAATDVDLLRLTLTTRNDGPGEILLGDPQCPNCQLFPGEVCGNDDFICSPADGHGHPHYDNFMRFELLDASGAQVGLGGKRSFCLRESGCIGPAETHTCENQGLAPGCWDTYPFYLGCQYIDVTGVPDGRYLLRVTIDPSGEIVETDEGNNVLKLPVQLDRGSGTDVALAGDSLLYRPGVALEVAAHLPEGDARPRGEDALDRAGALLNVFDLGSGAYLELLLPPEGWQALGTPPGELGWRYTGTGAVDDPCTSVAIGRRRVAVSCRGAALDLPLPASGPLLVQLTLGARLRGYCASFGGSELRNDALALKRRAAPPATCSP